MSDPSADSWLTVGDGPLVEHRDRGSRFLARALHVADEAAALAARAEARRRWHDATHHCLAFRIGPPEAPLERGDDDGEPSGTAGAPMLAAIRRAELCDVAVIVTRWFGGTKLGTGGLARAYGAAARAALEAAPRRRVERLAELALRCDWDVLGAVESELARHGDVLRGVERRFADRPCLLVRVLRSRAGSLAARLVDVAAGRIEIDGVT
ncbi:MAG: hypothetical protein Kow0062_22220 [Acidobacteriota bacterium]